MAWTLFWDMHSGGSTKEKWDKIYIEAPEDEARRIFFERFGHAPDDVACECCGENYAVYDSETLEDASDYHRKSMPLSEYIESEKVLVIRTQEVPCTKIVPL